MSLTTLTRPTLTDDTGDGESGDVVNAAFLGTNVFDVVDAIFAKMARCSVYSNVTQSIATGAFAALTFDSEDHDDMAMHSTVSNTSRITIPAGMGGIYLVGGGTFFAANATGVRQMQIRKNGTTVISSRTIVAGFSVSGVGPAMHVQALVSLAAADYIEIQVFQDSGGALNAGFAADRSLASQAYAARVL